MDAKEGIRITRGPLTGFTEPSLYVADSIIDAPVRVFTRRTLVFPMPPEKRPVSDAHHLCGIAAIHVASFGPHLPAKLLPNLHFRVFFGLGHRGLLPCRFGSALSGDLGSSRVHSNAGDCNAAVESEFG